MTAYFVADNGMQNGPFTLAEIKAQCSQGAIQAQTLMWRDGLGEWQAAAIVLQGTGIVFSSNLQPPPPPSFSSGARDAGDPHSTHSNAGLQFDVPAAKLSAGRGTGWIGEGWNLFKTAPGMWIVALLIWLGIQIALSLIPVLGSLASLLLGPSFAVGLLAFAHGIATNGNADLGALFAGFKDKLSTLVILALLYFVMVLGVVIIGCILVFMLLGRAALTQPENPEQMLSSMLASGGLPFLLVVTVIVALIALVVAAYIYAPGLVFFANQSAGEAMKQSFAACMRNWLPLLVFGLVAIALVIVGALPFGLGLLIVIPVLFAANYASFRDMFGR